MCGSCSAPLATGDPGGSALISVRRLATVATADGAVLEQCRIHDLRRGAQRATACLPEHGRAARKAHVATVSAPTENSGCTAGSTMFAPTTCTV